MVDQIIKLENNNSELQEIVISLSERLTGLQKQLDCIPYQNFDSKLHMAISNFEELKKQVDGSKVQCDLHKLKEKQSALRTETEQ